MGIILNKELVASTSFDKMKTSIYDTKNKQIDIYDYVDSRNFIIKIGDSDNGLNVGNSYEEKAINKIIAPERLSLKDLYDEINNNRNIVLELTCAPMGDFSIENRLNLEYYSMDEYGGNGEAGFKFSNDYFEAEMIIDDYIYVWKKQEPLYELPEDIGVQPDWNENDETAPDYIKNRTHWSETEKVIVYRNWGNDAYTENLENVTLTFDYGFNDCSTLLSENAYLNPNCFLDSGRTYFVIWDGVEYECICQLKIDEDIGINVLYIGAQDGTYPFYIEYNDTGTIISSYTNGESETGTTTHTLSLYEEIEIVHKLDEKWLSFGSAKPLIVTFSAETSWDEELGESVYSGSADKTFAEIDAAFENGIRVLGRYEDGEYTRLFECNTKYHAYGDLYFDFTSTGDQIGGYAIEFEHFRVHDNNTTERVSIKRIPTFDDVEIQINEAIGAAIGGSY